MIRTGYAVVLSVLALQARASAQVLLNGDFESPAFAANSLHQATPTSWSWSSSVGFVFNGLVFNPLEGSNWPTPQGGAQFVDIGNVPAFSLSQSFTIAAPGQYQLRWYDNAHSNGPTSPYSVTVRDGVLQTVASLNLDAAHGAVWQHRALLLDLAAGTYTVTFTAQGVSGGYDTLLDTVTIEQVVGAVPAISSWGMLIMTLGFLAIGLRYSRRSQECQHGGIRSR